MSNVPLWLTQAIAIAIITSAVLNSPLFIPYFRNVKVKRIDARVVGFGGTFAAFFLWCYLNPSASARDCALPACLIIVATVVGPNYLVHKCRGDDDDNGEYKTIRFEVSGMSEEGIKLLERELEKRAPGKHGLDRLYKKEQRKETPLERYENIRFPATALPAILDLVIACIQMALKTGQLAWLYTATEEALEARKEASKVSWNSQLFYKLYFHKYAR